MQLQLAIPATIPWTLQNLVQLRLGDRLDHLQTIDTVQLRLGDRLDHLQTIDTGTLLAPCWHNRLLIS